MAFSSTGAGAAAIMVSVPACAPGAPPLTGESTKPIPVGARAAAISRASCGRKVAVRITTAPAVRPWTSPSGPRIASFA